MEEIFIRDEFIKLGQALKFAGLVGSGIDAKLVIQDGLVNSMVKLCMNVAKSVMREILLSLKAKRL